MFSVRYTLGALLSVFLRLPESLAILSPIRPNSVKIFTVERRGRSLAGWTRGKGVPPQKILIIDDDETFRVILRDALTERGFHVAEASTGQEARTRLSKESPDLIILDVMIPDVDGVTICREIRSLEALKDVPVVAVSALGDPQTKSDIMLFGATDYVTKPIEISVLCERIEKALRQAESRRRIR